MSIRNELLVQIVIASGGTVRNPHNRNMLLEDWLLAVGLPPIPANALADYYLANNNLSSAIIDRVSGVEQLTNFTGTSRNLLQTSINPGTIETFLPAVQGFDRGVAASVEGVGVNEITNSSDLSAYQKTGIGAASPPTVTPNYALAPDGTMTATRVQMTLNGGTSTGDYARLILLIGAGTANIDYTQSWMMKSNDANTYQVGSLIKSQSTSDNYEVTPTWERHSKTTNTTSIGNNFGIQLRGGFGQSETVDILIWTSPKMGHQVEKSSYMSSFMYTNGAPETRNGDLLCIQTAHQKPATATYPKSLL